MHELIEELRLFLLIATVQNVLAVSVNSTAVLVAWDAVEVASVLRYTVYYERVEGDQRGGLDGSKDFPTSATFGIITGLSTGLQYSFQVTVFVEVLGQAYEGGRLEGKMAVPQDVQSKRQRAFLNSTACMIFYGVKSFVHLSAWVLCE